ncbi:MAG: hydantoinase/carbamoylase family amidase, partial [Neisseriaceae bacterium]|nr:hydantoinase/carbamoylase family amidase [Neisseriaceae bacterium]
ASLELHIEQGPILEKHNNVIGIVTGALGQKWYEIEFIGEASHAGTTPMNMRRDAGFGMARAMLKLHDLGMQECDMGGRITIGEVKLDPGSRNVIPGRAWFTLEIRHPNKQALEKMDKKIYDLMHHIGKTNKLDVLINKILSISPLNFDQRCISVVREVTRNLGYSHEDMISGAGHDSCYLNYVAPASMIFIPCVNGLSHNELEDITFEWSEAGAQVLAHSIVKLASHGFEI